MAWDKVPDLVRDCPGPSHRQWNEQRNEADIPAAQVIDSFKNTSFFIQIK